MVRWSTTFMNVISKGAGIVWPGKPRAHSVRDFAVEGLLFLRGEAQRTEQYTVSDSDDRLLHSEAWR
jgi:hypothetical protein